MRERLLRRRSRRGDARVGADHPGVRDRPERPPPLEPAGLARRADRPLAAGRRVPRRRLPARPARAAHRAVVDGDTRSAAIAAASIVAKVTRDRIMRRLDALYPRYGFSRHVGYITPVHSAAVRAHGPCDQHRLSYAAKCYEPEPARRGVNAGERRALWHYRLRGYRILGTNVRAGPQRARPDRAAWTGADVRRGEERARPGLRRGRRRGRRREAPPGPPGRPGVALSQSSSRRYVRVGFEVVTLDEGRLTADPATLRTLSRRVATEHRDREETARTRRRTIPVAATQEALYRAHDLELSWSEATLPERERTKHVHRLHPYLGKFIPQLVETLLERHVPAGRPGSRPVCRLGNDARAGPRVGPRRDRRRHRRVQRAARAREDAPVQPRRAAAGPALGARRGGGIRAAGPVPARCLRLRARVVRAGRGRGAAPFPLARRAGRLGGRAPRRARPFGSIRPENRPLRPRLPASAAARAVLVLQAPARVPSRSKRRAGSSCATRSTRSSGSRRSPPRRADGRIARMLHGDARAIDLGGPVRRCHHLAAVSGPDRLPRAAPLRVRAARASTSGVISSSAGPREARVGRRSRSTSTGSRLVLENARSSLVLGGRMCIVVNDRRDLYPEILQRAGLRLVDRHERHVNRRTGRRAGEYYESILVAAAR